MPSRIDRSILSHKSGSVQSQLLLAFHFFGLINRSGRPTENLKDLISGANHTRRIRFKDLIKKSYRFVFQSDFDIQTATSDQIEKRFRQTGASGETVRRCIAFFMSAARESNIQVSPYIKPHRGKHLSNRKNTTQAKSASEKPLPDRVSLNNSLKKIALRNGGTLTLQLDLDLFQLHLRDRDLIFELIDQINNYLKKKSIS